MDSLNFTSVTDQLHSVGDFFRFGASQFNQADLFFGHGSDNAWTEARTLAMFALSLPRELNDTVMDCRLIEEEKRQILALFSRRIEEQIPAAYLTNIAYFARLPFYVDERVLVPRSPIAELIEQQFASVVNPDKPIQRILDLCTGSACIAIACASYLVDVEVDAVDLSMDALNVAQINIENHGLVERVFPLLSDVFSGVEEQCYDLIVTNPPYVDQGDVDSLPAEYLHEPEMGLGSGVDGLDIVRVILAQSAQHLTEQGTLICEVGNSQIHVEALYPNVPFNWLEFEHGGHGVFSLTKAQLIECSDDFQSALQN